MEGLWKMQTAEKCMNVHGYKALINASKGVAPYFQNMLSYRVNRKLSTNIAVTGEPGIGKSYLATDLCRVHEGLDRKGNDRFGLDQICYFFSDYMDLTLKLKIGKTVMFDEPSYAMGKREWYKELNKALVATMESARFKVHPTFIPIINLSLLDKTIRQHLIQFQIVMHDRGFATVYRVKPSQFTEKVYYQYFCDLRYRLMDMNLCNRDSCLDCKQLLECNIFRARYERKKASVQDKRYEQAKAQAQHTESKKLTMKQLENLSLTVKSRFIQEDKLNVQRMRIALQDEYGIYLSQPKAYALKEALEVHHANALYAES